MTKFNLKDYMPDTLNFIPINDYSAPAMLALILILIESLFLWIALPETRNIQQISNKRKELGSVIKQEKGIKRRSLRHLENEIDKEIDNEDQVAKVEKESNIDKSIEKQLAILHFAFIFVFSGMEFTLTFLTFDRFEFSNTSQGRLLGFMGFCSAMFQGIYVRRVSRTNVSDKDLAVQGVIACGLGLLINGLIAYEPWILYFGCLFLSFTSGTVVNSLVALSSLMTSQESLGESLGIFRSFGQLGRSLGPIIFCTLYWMIGAQILYGICGLYMIILGMYLRGLKLKVKKTLKT